MKSLNWLLLALVCFSFPSFAYDICLDAKFKAAYGAYRNYNFERDKHAARSLAGDLSSIAPIEPINYQMGATYDLKCTAIDRPWNRNTPRKPKFIDDNVWAVDVTHSPEGPSEIRVYTEIVNEEGQSLVLSCNPEKEEEMQAIVFFEADENEGAIDDFSLIANNAEQMQLTSKIDKKSVELFDESDWAVLEGDNRGLVATMYKYTEDGQKTLEQMASGLNAEVVIVVEGLESFKKTMKFSLKGSRDALAEWGEQCKNTNVRSTLKTLP